MRSEAIFRWAMWAHLAALAYIVVAAATGLPLFVGGQSE